MAGDPKKEADLEKDDATGEVEQDADAGDNDEGGEEAADAAELPDEEGAEEEVDEEPPARSRGESRFQRLANEAREAKEETSRFRRELDELRATSRQQPTGETPEQEAQRLALMTTEERIEYRLDKADKRHEQQLRQIQYNTWENNDANRFQTLCASDPIAKRYSERVEQTRIDMMRQNGGQPIAREAILDVLIGRDVRAKRDQGLSKERGKGQENIRRQQARPGNAKGDVSAERRRKGSTAADRLDGVEI